MTRAHPSDRVLSPLATEPKVSAHSGNAPLRVLSLFAGIGGFDLGLERTGGFKTIAFCEIEKHSCKVLERHWPNVPNLGDVTTAEFPDADVIAAGFPCQDISLAGKGAGLAGARSGLWREVVRALRMVRPKFALLENVAALLGRGMGRVLGDLAEVGYDAEWDCIPAFAVGALHYRDRAWIIAYPDTNSLRPQRLRPAPTGAWCKQQFEGLVQDQVRVSLPAGRRSGISDGVSDRLGQLKAYGNAVVPQIPELIGRAILAAMRDSDTHPKDGDVEQAPLVSGAGRQASPERGHA